jgi:YbbR domain-containing protein
MIRVLRAIVYNWPLKLMAIVLASLLYAGLVVSQSTFEISTSLQIHPLNQPVNAVILGNLPPVTLVHYVASGDVGAGPTNDSFRATIDLSGVNPAAGATYVPIAVASNDPRFLAVDWEPRGINVQLDPFKTYTVNVVVNEGTKPDNLDVRPAQLSQSKVTVSGPDSVVRLVAAARADVLIDPSGLSVDRDVPLIPVDQLGNRLTPVTVEPASVHVTIAVFKNATQKVLPVNPVVTGTPPTGYVIHSIVVAPTTVTVEGNAEQLATLERADTLPIPIGAATGTISTDIGLDLPAGILPIGSSTVHVTIALNAETGTRTLAAGLIVRGEQPGMVYRYSTLSALVTIAGPLASLDLLDPATFTVPLDVTGLGVGVHEVTPTPNLQAGLGLLTIDPPTVTVTVAAPPSAAPLPSGG